MAAAAVREAAPADAQAVIGLWQAAGLTRPWNDPATDYHLSMENPASAVLLAEVAGEPAATIMVGYDGHRGWVYYLGVAPAFQRQGLGRTLMRAAEEWLTARDCPKIMLMVRSDNLATKAFYAALGYEPQAVETLGRRLDGR
ncbi:MULTISPECIES: GNAT family acetyltransferase [unclassified Novosphingobium]|uniref:GNAT family acetyltransferase n=1 Tax=unclassified Novosphingobium TaxID=2644732 RepID=UPI0014473432|nr:MULTISPECIES: GNAT family acetyltransferase [unclassified Novosphingobium]NKJ42830.1 ribosomal protein S18 acetylase RimI-like enzyme [Novosphingobium sp. SG720]NMN05534.1 ribosomal protein S18 acetylase RimI-like enzyme [Novosphingobium sp. SG919]NMN88107.1 ribosomal protein S18 acetylase RimI-like enzyme [Novosphingobium sp. SG916]